MRKLLVSFLIMLLPAGLLAGDFSAERLARARAIMTYNNANWREVINYYTADVVYQDPLIRCEGKDELHRFVYNLFRMTPFELVVEDEVHSGDRYMSTWVMTMDFFGGRMHFETEGASLLKFNSEDMCYYHRDYYSDADIWEEIPVNGWAVRQLRWLHRHKVLKDLPEEELAEMARPQAGLNAD